MGRHSITRKARALGAAFTLLLLLTSQATASATRFSRDDEGVKCTTVSTPNLVVTATRAGKDGPRLTLTVQTTKTQDSGQVSGNWNVVFRANIDGTDYVLERWDIHKVFLVDHETNGTSAAMEDDCSGGEGDTCDGGGGTGGTGDCGDGEESCGGGSEETGTTVAIRGQGYFKGYSNPVPFQMNLTDGGNQPGALDVIKVRWQSPNAGDEVQAEAGGCEGGRWVTHGWLKIENVQNVNIIQR